MLGDGPSPFSQGFRTPEQCGMTDDGAPPWVELIFKGKTPAWTDAAFRAWKYEGRKYRNSKKDAGFLVDLFPRSPKSVQEKILATLEEEHRWTLRNRLLSLIVPEG